MYVLDLLDNTANAISLGYIKHVVGWKLLRGRPLHVDTPKSLFIRHEQNDVARVALATGHGAGKPIHEREMLERSKVNW